MVNPNLFFKISKMRFLILLFFSNQFIFSQKQGNVWCFGEQSGINFNSGSPVVFGNGKTGTDLGPGETQEGTGCISDSSGKLLFYTSGKTIWNANHQIMLNGSGLNGGVSSTQAALIIPKPGSDSLFYVFTSDEFQSYTSPPQKGYCFSVVDMTLDNCKGGVIPDQKNILLMDTATEKLAACRDAAGTGYWIMGHKMRSDKFTAWHLTSSGITATVNTHIGSLHGWYAPASMWLDGAAQGQMKFNPAGTKLALVIGNYNPAILDMFSFNATTGVLSNPCHIVIDSALSKYVYGTEFSPDGTKLYVTATGGAGGKRLYQYDMTAGGGSCSSVEASRVTIFQSPANTVMFGLQLAPNNKIYCVSNDYQTLGCINAPNATGTACNFDSLSLVLSGTNHLAFPSFVANYSYSNGLVPKCNTLEVGLPGHPSEQSTFQIYPNPSSTKITVELAGSDMPVADIRIINLFGQTVSSFPLLCSGKKEISIDHLSDGTYFVVMETKFVRQTRKLIVLH